MWGVQGAICCWRCYTTLAYDEKMALESLKREGKYLCLMNALWLEQCWSGTPQIPISQGAIDQVKAHWFSKPKGLDQQQVTAWCGPGAPGKRVFQSKAMVLTHVLPGRYWSLSFAAMVRGPVVMVGTRGESRRLSTLHGQAVQLPKRRSRFCWHFNRDL